MSSRNKTIITTLIETFQRTLEPAKMYSCLQKVNADLDEVWSQVNEGPLPTNNGKNLDLSEVPEDNLPDTVAFTDKANVFVENQTIDEGKALHLLAATPNLTGNIKPLTDGSSLIVGIGFDHDGVTYSGTGSGIIFESGGITTLARIIGGTLQKLIRATASGIISIGTLVTETGAAINDLVMKNGKVIRGTNFGGTTNLAMINIDANDLIILGGDAVSSGAGHVHIPHVASANVPTAGATKNGIILIDKDNNWLVYYSNGNRYKIVGTSF